MPAEETESASEKVLCLRTCTAEMRGTHPASQHFVWPESGPVECGDWNPEPVCGYGLHGLLWGCGDGWLLAFGDPDAKWLVVEVLATDVVTIDCGEKVKFPRGVVVFCGDRTGATEYVYSRKPGAVAGVSLNVTDQQAALGGYASTLTGGYASTLTGGDRSTLTGGDDSTLTGGDRSILIFKHWDGRRWRMLCGQVGEEGIESGKPYRVNAEGKIVPAEVSK